MLIRFSNLFSKCCCSSICFKFNFLFTYGSSFLLFTLQLDVFDIIRTFCYDPTRWGGGGGGEEELYTQMGFFLFSGSDNFGRSIYSSQRNVSGIIKKLIQRRIQN